MGLMGYNMALLTMHIYLGTQEIPLVTVGDSVFPRYSCLMKNFSENTGGEEAKTF